MTSPIRAMRPASGTRPAYRPIEWRPISLSPDSVAPIPELAMESDPGAGRVVSVRATPEACRDDWAALATVAIARAWAGFGARVLVADLFFDNPHLHRVFGARNLEGVADAIDYGASLKRIVRAAEGGKFWVATAGTPVGSSASLLARPRWRELLQSLVEGGVTVLTYQPAEVVVPPRETPSLVLACKGEPMTALGKVGLRNVRALLGPPQDASPAPVRQVEASTLSEQSYQDAFGVDAPDFGAPARDVVAPAASTPALETDEGKVAGAIGENDRWWSGRAAAVAAFGALLLVATLLTLVAIQNAGIAEVPGAGWVSGLFEQWRTGPAGRLGT